VRALPKRPIAKKKKKAFLKVCFSEARLGRWRRGAAVGKRRGSRLEGEEREPKLHFYT
jgi:hypothetical protein